MYKCIIQLVLCRYIFLVIVVLYHSVRPPHQQNTIELYGSHNCNVMLPPVKSHISLHAIPIFAHLFPKIILIFSFNNKTHKITQ